jgi:SAM-dependent methyltransferase
MKIHAGTVFLFLLLAFTEIACNWQARNTQVDDEHTNHADSLNNKGFENEIKVYESPDRVIWQKPDLVIEQLGEVEGKVVADLGAGTGYFSRRIAYKGARVIAIDIDPRMIEWMKEQKAKFPEEIRDRLIIRQADPDNSHLKTNEVDKVLLVNTYSYISDRVAYFTRLKSAIRRGGIMVIIDFKKKETPFGPALEERMDATDVEKELKEAGYDILKVDEESLEYQYIIKAQRN